MAASSGPLLNGVLPTSLQPVNEALEYEKILRIRDEVFSGSHPRLTVPAHAIRVPASQTPSTLSQTQLNVPPPFPPSASPNHLGAATQGKREDETTPAQTKPNGVSVATANQPTSNVSEFDPVLLTKSDDLVRAEIQLKRQRLERALREQFEHRKADARKKPAPAEAKPDFDLPAIFARVTGAVKSPSSKEDVDATDSFDEDAYYSSKAPDSTPERPPSDSTDDADEEQADEPSGARVVSAVMGAPLYSDAADGISAQAAPPAPLAVLPPKSAAPVDTAAMDMDEDEEEGEYSPPEAMVQYPTPKVTQAQEMQDSRDPRGRPLRRYSELEDGGGRPGSPSEANMRIVRNHITSPICPQPSRVSPLAITKDSPLLQNARPRRKQWIGRPGSPTSPDDMQALPPKKKRKLEAREARNARKSRRNGGTSPDGLIKEEDVSPPPFHDVQPLGSGRFRTSRADQPIVIDEDPVQGGRYMPPPERYVESPSRLLPRRVEQLMPLSEPRPLSRASVRPARDDQDLRRVASMHSLRAEQPREYVDQYYESPSRPRAVSYARVESPALVEPGRPPREVAVEYDQPPPEVRVVRTPAPVYREVYDDRDGTYHRYAVEPMPPPPPPPVERIVIDQYGRRFREIIQERPSVVPRAMSVRGAEVEPRYEEYPRQARAGSVFVEAAPERAYPSEMPPPPVSYHRLAEPPRSSAVPGSAPREYLEPAPPIRSSSVQVMDRPVRQPVYADERTEFREPVRMGSVRPPPALRYEEPLPVEFVTRGQSTRPVGREGSVFVDDRRPVLSEYVPVEQPRYRPMEPERRYVDAEDRERLTLDGSMDGRPRVVERY
ncbi:uncharacterized protein Z520_06809 [Fonsecaea multimorphosa CBS 102226]|uniref:Uncharacterized protein n=1 Tax=Fonsecaea multimorphosa CBS 102226 TaxID=1442371 RepID=A0A0D2JV51_9EURO|nr:uncharacterized protein Z520_06809 [Fonsecaea multimorphosa CBS 102226]KIX97357.1 hypothetical protein Z520_06809 [Fonsecaea multimorphosa CBS 102226]OAL23324.1 hypothetical protein AYO22_06374 [Fonsecaea multimorphosa]